MAKRGSGRGTPYTHGFVTIGYIRIYIYIHKYPEIIVLCMLARIPSITKSWCADKATPVQMLYVHLLSHPQSAGQARPAYRAAGAYPDWCFNTIWRLQHVRKQILLRHNFAPGLMATDASAPIGDGSSVTTGVGVPIVQAMCQEQGCLSLNVDGIPLHI